MSQVQHRQRLREQAAAKAAAVQKSPSPVTAVPVVVPVAPVAPDFVDLGGSQNLEAVQPPKQFDSPSKADVHVAAPLPGTTIPTFVAGTSATGDTNPLLQSAMDLRPASVIPFAVGQADTAADQQAQAAKLVAHIQGLTDATQYELVMTELETRHPVIAQLVTELLTRPTNP